MVENFGESITTEFGAQSYPTWDSKGTYVQYQRVQHKGLTYGAKKTSVGEEPNKDSEYWELLGSLPVKQGEPRDTLIFENDDKTQSINGKGITGTSPINVDNGDTVNTVSVDTATKSQLGVVKAGTNINISNGSISVPTATTNQKGVMQVGDGLIVDSGTVSVPTGSTEQKGLLQVGDGISVNDGIISAQEYELPTASADTLGGVKVGDGLSIADGVLSASSSGSGWETIASTTGYYFTDYFSINAYKSANFILVNAYLKKEFTITQNNWSFCTINITSPFLQNVDSTGGLVNRAIINPLSTFYNIGNFFVNQENNKIYIGLSTSDTTTYSKIGNAISFLIPYMEL